MILVTLDSCRRIILCKCKGELGYCVDKTNKFIVHSVFLCNLLLKRMGGTLFFETQRALFGTICRQEKKKIKNDGLVCWCLIALKCSILNAFLKKTCCFLDRGITGMDAVVRASKGALLVQSSEAEHIPPWNDCAHEQVKQRQNSGE